MHTPAITAWLGIGLAVMVLAACGGGGGVGGGGGGGGQAAPRSKGELSAIVPIAPGGSVLISGRATYSSPQVRTVGGLDLDGADDAGRRRPIRGAFIEVHDAAGLVRSRGFTDANGNYSLAAPINSNVSVVALAAIGFASTVEAEVVDNTNGRALYAVALPVTTTTVNLVNRDFNAATGWDDASNTFTAARAAAPFAVLDVAFAGRALVRSANPTAVFPALGVNWSINNSVATVGTSFYSSGTGDITLLGAANSDTDEFDSHVVAHEWTHYFEDAFSRSDSLGGGHGPDNRLDVTVAFGEGLGNSMAGMILGNPVYIDTNGGAQLNTGLIIDVEDDTLTVNGIAQATGTDGFWSEFSVGAILWDLFDPTGSVGLDDDNDGADFGFTPIFQVLTGTQRTTPAFTAINTFLTGFRAAFAGNGPAVNAINAIAASEDITATSEFQAQGTGNLTVDGVVIDDPSLYTNAPVGSTISADVNGRPLATHNEFGAIVNGNPGNKLFNRQLFSTVMPASGRVLVTVVLLTNNRRLVLTRPGVSGDAIGGFNQDIEFTLTGAEGEVRCFGIGSEGGAGGEADFDLVVTALPSN